MVTKNKVEADKSEEKKQIEINDVNVFELGYKCVLKLCSRKQYDYIKSFENVHFKNDRGKSDISAMLSRCPSYLASEIIVLAKSGKKIVIKY